MKKALITGITGQDGSYLTELLLAKGYQVHGLVRRVGLLHGLSLDDIHPDFKVAHRDVVLHYGDLGDSSSIKSLVRDIQPDEIYNLAALSHVQVCYKYPELTGSVNGLAPLRILEAVRHECPKAKLYQASSSELFGFPHEVPQKETTQFHPRNPYGVSKLYAHWAVVNYREAYNLFACNGILFTHESPRRGTTFLTRKITCGIARMLAGEIETLAIGNMNAVRDWGYAKDYVEGMWRMLQYKHADDYVLATGESHSVREFIQAAFQCVGITLDWVGEGILERGIDRATGKVKIEVDPKYFRLTEVELLCGDFSKAKERLGWAPTVFFNDLVKMMVEHDLKLKKVSAAAAV